MIGADGKEYPRHVDTVRTRKPVSVFNPTKREERAMDFSYPRGVLELGKVPTYLRCGEGAVPHGGMSRCFGVLREVERKANYPKPKKDAVKLREKYHRKSNIAINYY